MTPTFRIFAAALCAAALGITAAADKPTDPAPPRKPATYWQSQSSRDNLQRVALAIHRYHDEHGEVPKDITDKHGRPVLSWRVAILPYLDLDFLHAQFRLDEPWDGPTNRKLLAFMPNPFRAPVQDPKAADTFVQAVVGEGAVFDGKAKVGFASITDGMSNTLLLAEAGPAVPWTKPADIPFGPAGKLPTLEGPYADAVHVVAADGSAFRMSPRPRPDDLRLFILRDDGEVFERDRLKAAPVKPATVEDKKQFEERRAYALKQLRWAAGYAEDRFKCEQELRKLGDPPQPDPTKLETLEELEEMLKEIEERRWADSHEYYRLIEHVRTVAPKAAARIELGRQERVAKEESMDK